MDSQFYYNKQLVLSNLKVLETDLKSEKTLEEKIKKEQKEQEEYKKRISRHDHKAPTEKHYENIANMKILEQRRKRVRAIYKRRETIGLIIAILIMIPSLYFVFISARSFYSDLSKDTPIQVIENLFESEIITNTAILVISILAVISHIFITWFSSAISDIFSPKNPIKLTKEEQDAIKNKTKVGVVDYILGILGIGIFVLGVQAFFCFWGFVSILISTILILIYGIITRPSWTKKITKAAELTQSETDELEQAKLNDRNLYEEYKAKINNTIKENKERYTPLIHECSNRANEMQKQRELIIQRVQSSTIVANCYKNLDCVSSVISSMERYPEYTLTDALKDYDKYKADLIRMQYESQRRFEKEQELKEELNKIATDFNNSLDRIRDAENQRTQAIQDELYKLRKELNDN